MYILTRQDRKVIYHSMAFCNTQSRTSRFYLMVKLFGFQYLKDLRSLWKIASYQQNLMNLFFVVLGSIQLLHKKLPTIMYKSQAVLTIRDKQITYLMPQLAKHLRERKPLRIISVTEATRETNWFETSLL